MPQPANPNIEIVVVVSGQPERIRVNANQTLEHVARDRVARARQAELAVAWADRRTFTAGSRSTRFLTSATIRGGTMHDKATQGLPSDLASVLRDQSVVVPQDADVFDLIGRWRTAPASTASAEIITTNMSLVDAIYQKSSAASSTTPAGCC